jgi:hypothetical protein
MSERGDLDEPGVEPGPDPEWPVPDAEIPLGRRPLRRAKRPERVLDWQPNHDPRSRGYAAVGEVDEPPSHDVRWRPGPVLDQGREGACVGYACLGEVLAEPTPGRLAVGNAVRWYKRAQRADDWPGEGYEGTSVNAGMRIGREFGWWDGWRWTFGVEDMRSGIRLGPMVLGIPWTARMYRTAADGIVRGGGEQVGGHCLLVVGWATDYAGHGPGFWWLNSWGRGYGINGAAFVPEETMHTLIDGVGECAVPVGRSRGRSLDV